VDELEEHFGKMCPRVRAAVAKIKRNRRWPMLDRLPIPNWTRNRITLLEMRRTPCFSTSRRRLSGVRRRRMFRGQPEKNTVATRRARSSHTRRRESSARRVCRAWPGFLARSTRSRRQHSDAQCAACQATADDFEYCSNGVIGYKA